MISKGQGIVLCSESEIVNGVLENQLDSLEKLFYSSGFAGVKR